jgi:chaperonin GroES
MSTRSGTLALAIFVTLANVAVAGAAQPARATDQEVKRLLARIETNAEQFRASLMDAPARESLAGWEKERNIDHFVAEFVAAARRLRVQFDRGRVAAPRVDEVLRRGASIDSFMERRSSADRAQRDWLTVRRDLEALAIAYNVPWSQATPRLTSVRPDTPLHVAGRARRAPPLSAASRPGAIPDPGSGRYTDEGTRVPRDVNAGDLILFDKYSGQEIKLDGEEYLVMREDDVLAAFNGASPLR